MYNMTLITVFSENVYMQFFFKVYAIILWKNMNKVQLL